MEEFRPASPQPHYPPSALLPRHSGPIPKRVLDTRRLASNVNYDLPVIDGHLKQGRLEAHSTSRCPEQPAMERSPLFLRRRPSLLPRNIVREEGNGLQELAVVEDLVEVD